MPALDKVKVPVAAPGNTKKPLPIHHLTSANFMQYNIAFNREVLPGSSGKINFKTFMRCEPMDKPCLGSAVIHNRFFLVPYRTVWVPFNDFITDTPRNMESGTAIIPQTPYLHPDILMDLFTGNSEYSSTAAAGTAYDYCDDNGVHYRLTPFGRQAWKILEQLGYRVFPSKSTRKPYSALPLLAAVKCYIDWFYPSAYGHYGDFATIDGIFQRNFTYTLSEADLLVIFRVICTVAYDNDFFCSVQDNPVAGSAGTFSNNYGPILDVTLASGVGSTTSVVTQSPSLGTPFLTGRNSSGANATLNNLSQYEVSSLEALNKYIARHRLAGSRVLDRYLLQYGLALDAAKLQRSLYLGDDSFPFEISDVMSHSDTSDSQTGFGASLGSYAGKGIGYSGDNAKTVDFDSPEWGQLIVVSTIIPDVSYVQGIDKNVMHTTRLSFVTPEFDGLGPDVVSRAELAVSYNDVNFNAGIQDEKFGFAPRYYESKIPYQRQTGIFNFKSLNADELGWSTARLFDVDADSASHLSQSDLTHNLDFVLGKDALQYDRIFLGYLEDAAVDPFRVVHRGLLEMYDFGKSLYDTYEFEDENTKKVLIEPHGVKMN